MRRRGGGGAKERVGFPEGEGQSGARTPLVQLKRFSRSRDIGRAAGFTADASANVIKTA